MISFIVIGKNVENTIEICLKSILNFIESNGISNSEIIYIDSDSNDKTIELAQKYSIQIYKIKGEINAAIGRNEGANMAKGNTLFFIDGDMEIYSDFYSIAFQNEDILKYPFCSGDYLNIYYDSKFTPLKYSNYAYGSQKQTDNYELTSGGLFATESKYWELLKGMDERLIRNQDLDFGIRMARKEIPLLRYKELLANHHTIDYFEKDRIKVFLKSKNLLCFGILIRKHILYPKFFLSLLRSRYSMFILLLSVLYKYIILLYVAIQIFRVLKSYKRTKSFGSSLLYKITSDIYCIAGTLFYYPAKKKYTMSKIS